MKRSEKQSRRWVSGINATEKDRKAVERLADYDQRSVATMLAILVHEALEQRGEA